MALATANTSSTTLPELIAFMGNRLGQTRANQLLAKVGHLLTLEQQYTLQETYLYGSSRLGVKNQQLTLSTRVASVQNGSLTPIGNAILNTDSVFSGTAAVYGLPKAPTARIFNRTWGLKQYELSNHLGNVQVTISDKKHGVVGSNQVDFIAYEPEVKSATDYYAYGMEMPGKTYQSTAYRYGMNTQEKDNEIYGPGNTLGALYWEYDARIARRWNVDPVVVPSLSNYHAFEGNPIMMVDPLGNSATKYKDERGKLLENTNDGNNSEITVKDSEMDDFVKRMEKAKKNGTQDKVNFNIDMIQSLTTSKEGVLFSSHSFAMQYIKRVSDKMTDKIELSGFALAKNWFYLNPTEGVNVFTGEYIKNNGGESFNFTQVINSKITIEGKVYEVLAWVHSHPGGSAFSGFTDYGSLGYEANKWDCIQGCDAFSMKSNAWKATGINKWILIRLNGEYSRIDLARVHFGQPGRPIEAGRVTTFRNFIKQKASFNAW